MIKFKYRYCKVHMAQYLSGDLSDAARRRIARFIDECQDCYLEYIRQVEFVSQLERELPALGRPDSQRLDALWASIQTELNLSDRTPSLTGGGKQRSNWSFGYGLVMLALSIALMIPMTVGYHASVAALDLPPRPQTAEIARTPTTAAQNRYFAFASTRSKASHRRPLLQNTPAANFHQ